jgi:general secretion pathway protein F
MRFLIKTVSNDDVVATLTVEAEDEMSARAQVIARGFQVLAVQHGASVDFSAALVRKIRFPVTFFSIELIALLDAGLNLVEAVQGLSAKEENQQTRATLTGLLGALREGLSFSQALSRFPQHFPPIYCAVVKASERSGDLRAALAKYVTYEQAFGVVRRKLSAALVYPVVLVVVGSLVMVFLAVYVIPRFARLYDERRGPQPIFANLLQHFGQFMSHYGHWVVAGLCVLVVGMIIACRQAVVQVWLTQRVWSIPAMGRRMRLFQLARMFRTLGMLLRSGVPLVPALDMVAPVLAIHLRTQLGVAKRAIEEGQAISSAFGLAQLTTPVAAQMLTVGERSGQMGEMMERIAGFCDEELERWLDKASRLFEPVIMAVIGVCVGGVVVLMYMPIFELSSSLR